MKRAAILALITLVSMICPAQNQTSHLQPKWSFALDTNDEFTEYPGGFDNAPAGSVLVGTIPSESGFSDGRGAIITVSPGDVELLLFPTLHVGEDLVTIRASVQAIGSGAGLALAALNGTMDGAIGTNVPGNSGMFLDQYKRLVLTYDPPGTSVIPAFQVANLAGTQPVSVYLDNLEVFLIPKDAQIPSNLLHGESITPTATPTPTPTNTPLSDGDTLLIREEDYEKAFIVEQGDKFSIRLSENISTGYSWTLGNINEQIAFFEQSTFAFNTPNDPNSGATRTFTFLAKSAGTTKIELLYRQSWNTVPVNRFETTVIVKARTPSPSPPLTVTPTPYVDEEDRMITIPLPGLSEKAKPLEMVLINGGSFTMGSPRSQEFRESNEWPQHEVTISKDFYMGRYEVTQGQWQALMGRNPAGYQDGNLNHPVENVSWNDCKMFIERLNDLGLGQFRLPTEAEWEYACRAGTDTRFYWGEDPDEVQVKEHAWYTLNSENHPREVGLKRPNNWGLYDMSGNVYEWCQDWFAPYSKEAKSQVDPTGPAGGISRVNRGGSWNLGAWNCRSAHRVGYQPHFRYIFLGFRIVRERGGEISPTPTPTTRPSPTPTPTPISPDFFIPTPTPTPDAFTPDFSQLSRTFGTGTDSPGALALGDLDTDGDTDIVVGNTGKSEGEQNWIYLNDSTGVFDVSIPFGTGKERTNAVALGDADRDGDLDLAAGNDWQTGNAVYLNDEGIFERIINVGPGTDDTYAIAFGDVDRDGDPDLIVGTKQYSKQTKPSSVYLNGGFGSFTQGIQFGDSNLRVWCMAEGDVDGDRDLDLAVGNDGQNVILLNDGTGRFNTSVPFGSGQDRTYSLALGDVDRDGDIDLTVGNYGQKNVVYLNDGQGHFEAARYIGEHASKTTCVVLGDIDGDLDLDLIVGNHGEQNRILLNSGIGEFAPGLYFGTGSDNTTCLACGDLDNDSDLDLVVGNEGQPNVIYFNTGR